jgi:hypothetical protein
MADHYDYSTVIKELAMSQILGAKLFLYNRYALDLHIRDHVCLFNCTTGVFCEVCVTHAAH